jgi:hypothetical protein
MFHELLVHQIELTMQKEALPQSSVELDGAPARYFNLCDLSPPPPGMAEAMKTARRATEVSGLLLRYLGQTTAKKESITNAHEAVGDGRGSIHLNMRTVSAENIPGSHPYPIDQQPKDTAYACLEVVDPGCGISDRYPRNASIRFLQPSSPVEGWVGPW